MKKQWISSLLFLTSASCFLTAFGDKHSTVVTKERFDGKKLSIDFIVQPNKGMMITQEGPWSLTLSNLEGSVLPGAAQKLETKTFVPTLPGFAVDLDLASGSQEVRALYTVKAFVCTEDKKHCYPQRLEGKYQWKKP